MPRIRVRHEWEGEVELATLEALVKRELEVSDFLGAEDDAVSRVEQMGSDGRYTRITEYKEVWK